MLILTIGNSLRSGVSGKSGDIVFRQHEDKAIVIRSRRRNNRKPTPMQAQARMRFREAARFAKAVMQDPAQRSLYEKKMKRRGNNLYRSLVTEYLLSLSAPSRLSAPARQAMETEKESRVKAGGLAVKTSPSGIQRKLI